MDKRAFLSELADLMEKHDVQLNMSGDWDGYVWVGIVSASAPSMDDTFFKEISKLNADVIRERILE